MTSTIAIKNITHVEFSAGKEQVFENAKVDAADGWLVLTSFDNKGQFSRFDMFPPHAVKKVWAEKAGAVVDA